MKALRGKLNAVGRGAGPTCRVTSKRAETTPKPTEWWLRPVISAARVGEHSDVEWKLV